MSGYLLLPVIPAAEQRSAMGAKTKRKARGAAES
jgi:hypothetical protein